VSGSISEITAVIAGTIVLLTLAISIISIVVLQQRRLFNIQQKNLEALQESEDRYRRLVKFSPIPMGVFIHDVIVYINDAGVKLLAAGSPEQAIGSSISAFVKQPTIEPSEEDLQSLFGENRQIANLEQKILRHDGHLIDIELTAIPIVYDGQDAVQVVVRDITERKRQEMELISAKDRAEQSDKLKDAFIANISHEIRTPLNVILGYSNLIMTEFRSRIRQDEIAFFESIERGGQRLMRTVEHILNISSIQVGSFELRPEVIELNSRIQKLILDLQSFATEKGLTIELQSETEHAYIHADRYCIDQALTNLIDNAIKFTNRGGVTIRVYAMDQRIGIDVTDTGIGISSEYLPKVFNVFSQEITGYTRPFEGLGLGLALTRRYIEMNGGSVTVKSRKGVGTTFTLRFMSAESLDTLQETLQLEQPQRTRQAHPHIRPAEAQRALLIVEDDLQTQEYMRVLFKKDFSIHLAASGEEAWDVLNSTYVDCILMDLSLRGNEDGLQLTRRIRQIDAWTGIPIIAITAHAFPEDKTRSLDAGCDRYFSKPFQIEDVRVAIEELIA
jgi:PAS domain S-box-containing protein